MSQDLHRIQWRIIFSIVQNIFVNMNFAIQRAALSLESPATTPLTGRFGTINVIKRRCP